MVFFNTAFIPCQIGTLRPACNANSVLDIGAIFSSQARILIQGHLRQSQIARFGPRSAVLEFVADMSLID
jgi:hypothetical protein